MTLSDFKLGDLLDWSSLIFPRVFPNPIPPNILEGVDQDRKKELVARSHIPLGYVMVIEPQRPNAVYKLAAGHKLKPECLKRPDQVPDITPLDTAWRELIGETNINVSKDRFRYIGKWLGPLRDHWKPLFSVDITEEERDWMGDTHPENEGEVPTYFTVEEFHDQWKLGMIMPEHYRKLTEFALIMPEAHGIRL